MGAILYSLCEISFSLMMPYRPFIGLMWCCAARPSTNVPAAAAEWRLRRKRMNRYELHAPAGMKIALAQVPGT